MASEQHDPAFSNPEKSEDTVLSMVDVLEEEAQLEADANAVLGDSDDKNCTYPLGYIPRQAIYACGTCTPPNSNPAALCLACSFECHEGHDLFELYTKRNLRCDCGNSKFGDFSCKLYTDKSPVNANNTYNQNFTGLYCVCKRPYPDPEDDVEDEMIQCIICEDWYHGRHLGASTPPNEDYQEMICVGCMGKNKFLWAYAAHMIGPKDGDIEVDVVSVQTPVKSEILPSANTGPANTEPAVIGSANSDPAVTGSANTEPANTESGKIGSANTGTGDPGSASTGPANSETANTGSANTASANTGLCNTDTGGQGHVATGMKTESTTGAGKEPASNHVQINGDHKTENTFNSEASDKTKTEYGPKASCKFEGTDNSCSEPGTSTRGVTKDACKLGQLQNKKSDMVKDCAAFWPAGWRAKLCTCDTCKEMYTQNNIQFITDESDTVHAYEARGLARDTHVSQYDKGLKALSGMNRVQQVEMLSGFQDLKSELTDYLKRFAENGKVVREEDIREFFEQMRARKRQRVDGPPQYLCK